jgi:hypothetical protein
VLVLPKLVFYGKLMSAKHEGWCWADMVERKYGLCGLGLGLDVEGAKLACYRSIFRVSSSSTILFGWKS